MRAVRRPLPSLVAVASVFVLSLTGCGDSASRGGTDDYPLVETPPQPALPTMYEAEPSQTCERMLATFHDGSEPARRPVVVPPAPGLRATAVTERRTRVEWSFRDTPDECRPVVVRLSVVAAKAPLATPTSRSVDISTNAGSAEITYPDFLPPPDVAHASAYSGGGHRSRVVSVRIRRGPQTPLDPPDAPPPVTAAGEPVACGGRRTTIDDDVGDVLGHAPGSPPQRVPTLTPPLSGIDITRATFQIQDRTICAAFVFDRPPPRDAFELTLTLRDTTTPSCCASLRLRRTAGRFEVGFLTEAASGASLLAPVPNGGASLQASTVLLSGTLPPPHAWAHRSAEMPAADAIGWSVTSAYIPEERGPFYGDWIPRYAEVGEPVVRHRDGATVEPGAAR